MEPLRRPYPRHQQHSRQQQALPPADEDLLQDEEEEDAGGDVWPQRLPSSARRYQGVTTEDVPRRAGGAAGVGGRAATPIPRRSSAPSPAAVGGRPQRLLPARAQSQEEEEAAAYRRKARRRVHWLAVVVMALGTMLVGWVLLTLLSTWGQVTWDDVHYGRPRTFQCDAVVGHGNDSVANPSHFIALNLHHQVEIIEFPGGDSTHAKIYPGPTLVGPGQDLAAVTLTFKDVNGDGKPDMLVNVLDSHFTFINDHGQFRLARPGEQVNPES